MMISRDTQKVFYLIRQSLQIKMKKNRKRRKPLKETFKDDKYQLPKADRKYIDR